MLALTHNPATGAVLRSWPLADRSEAGRMLAAAAGAARDWSFAPWEVRVSWLRAVAAGLRTEADALAWEAALEMGKPLSEGLAEVAKCAAWCDVLAAEGPGWLGPETVPGAGGREIHRRPVGVVLSITPWNYPYWQAVRAVVPALVAGNAALFRPATNVAGCGERLAALLRPGLPPGVFHLVRCSVEVVSALASDPRLGLVTFTGSTAAGRQVAAAAAAGPTKCLLELGGSDPYLVLADADLDLAAETCAGARLVNNGQSCVAAKRLIVAEEVAEAFLERLGPALARRRVGDPLASGTDLGPLARPSLRTELERLVAESAAAGARLVWRGRAPDGPGFLAPVLLDRVRPDHAVARKETFGPVAAVLRAPSEAAALAWANASPYGLGAAVFSRDAERARQIATGLIDAGMVAVNAALRSDPRVPFGGTKASGYGRELGRLGLLEFTSPKVLHFG